MGGQTQFCHNFVDTDFLLNNGKTTGAFYGVVVHQDSNIKTKTGTNGVQGDVWIRIGLEVYNVTEIVRWNSTILGENPFPNELIDIINLNPGLDLTEKRAMFSAYLPCLDDQYWIGSLDTRDSALCQSNSYIVYILTGFVSLVMLIRFLWYVRSWQSLI